MTPLEVLRSWPPHGDTVGGLFASRMSDRPCLLADGQVLSWGEVDEQVVAAAGNLVRHGVGPGDRVAVVAPNSGAYVVLWLAVARIGAVLVPVNPALGGEELSRILDHAEPALVVRDPAAWTASGPPVPLPDVDPDETCVIVYTSGSTGFPKGVMHSQRTVVAVGEAFVERMWLQPDDRLLCVLPLFHINALLYSVGGALAAGGSLVMAPRFSASGFWPLVASSGATEVNLLAAVGSILVRRPRTELVAGHTLRKVYGAPIPEEVGRVFRSELGVPAVVEGYGMTEIPGVCSAPFPGSARPGIGLPARHPDPTVPFAELRVVDEAGADVPDETVGELWVRTPVVMQGYFRDPEGTAAAFSDGWFRTGDLVRRAADGWFTFVARRKDIIRRRGENVAGAELDRVVGEHPAVLEAAAVGVPSDLGEEEILVAVVPRPGEAVTAEEIAAWCASRLNPAKVPRYVAIVGALPHTPTHRIAKFRVREDPAVVAATVDLRPGA